MTVKKKIHTTHYAIALDASGSMAGLKENVIKAFNLQLQTIRNSVNRYTKATVTFVVFGDARFGDTPMVQFDGVNAKDTRDLVGSDYQPSGMTALWEATNLATKRIAKLTPNLSELTSYVVITITDGGNNLTSFYQADVKNAIREGIANDRWTHVFIGPRGSLSAFQSVGALPGNCTEWDQTVTGTQTMGQTMSTATTVAQTYRGTTQSTSNNALGYFHTDASAIKAKDLKKLVNLAPVVKVYKVTKENNIKDFIVAKKKPFFLGAGYYELMKDEKIQANKQLLVMDKVTKAVYGGPEARQLLGLPENVDCKVTPGNHGKYTIFVQSTSHNRILPRGTTIVYRLDQTTDVKHTWLTQP